MHGLAGDQPLKNLRGRLVAYGPLRHGGDIEIFAA
jgi:hypothetical protein